MDAYSPQSTQPPSSRGLKVVGIALAVLVLIAALVVGYFGLIRHVSLKKQSGALSNASFIFAAADVPAPAARFASRSGLSLITIPEQGTATLYDEARAGTTTTYYLLSGPAAGQSTLYRKATKGGLEQVSTSTSMKLELSVNEPARIAAFTSFSSGSPSVTVIDTLTHQETTLGAGAHPAILGDGAHVLFERAGSLVSASRVTKEAAVLMKLAPGALFAVNPHTSELAVYDPATHILQKYWIGDGMATVTPSTSAKLVGAAPSELVYYGDQVFAVTQQKDAFSILPAGKDAGGITVPAPGISLAHMRFISL